VDELSGEGAGVVERLPETIPELGPPIRLAGQAVAARRVDEDLLEAGVVEPSARVSGAYSYGDGYSTAVKPAFAARSKRCSNGTSVKSQPRLAAKRRSCGVVTP
jgi:hypothetical protein